MTALANVKRKGEAMNNSGTMSEDRLVAKTVTELLTNGFGQRADRLVLTTAEGRGLGGWGEVALARILTEFADAVLAERKAGR